MTKTEESDRIIYQTETATIILYKDNTNLHLDITTAWPVPDYSNWQEYATSIEETTEVTT